MDRFKAFYEAHREKLFSYLMRMTGDYHLSSDVLQDSFTRILEKYAREEMSLPLLYRIARNALIDIWRRQQRERKIENEHPGSSENPEQDLLVRDDYRRVLEGIQRLEKNEREILSLVVSGDLSYREIAAILGISESNVKVRVHRARLRLKNILKGDYQ